MWNWIAFSLVWVFVLAVLVGWFAPRRLVRFCFKPILWCLYRRRFIGLENFPREGGVVVAANHVSWIDGILLLWMLPRNVRFIVDAGNFESTIGGYLGRAFDTIFMTSSPKSIGRALKTARAGIRQGDVIGIFPEGTLTRTGHLQGFRPGITKVLKEGTGVVVPIWTEGMWGSVFSFSGGRFFWKIPSWPRRTISMYVGKPLPPGTSPEKIRNELQALGARGMIDARVQGKVIIRKVIRRWKARGSRMKVADSMGTEVGGRQLLMRTLILRRLLRREVLDQDEEVVGLLLPPSVAAVAANIAVALDRRVTANLNYTTNGEILNQCIESAKIKHVITSKAFLERFDFNIAAKVTKLEDLKQKVTFGDKVAGALAAYLIPAIILERILGLTRIQSDDLLTIIFTSGSTGTPKGVMLSYANIGHNVDVIERAIRLNEEDVVLGVLPFFHSFGYSVTLWATQVLGPAGIYHFNPLDARQVGKLASKYGATVLLGTPTFLRGYMRRVKPEQFAKLDVVVVGAEKMPTELFDAFEKRFGVRPVEGYGATELSPLVSVNVPASRSVAKYQSDREEGSVGRPCPGVCTRVVSPDDGQELEPGEDGMLLITGPNVMKGYLGRDDLTSEAVQNGWYVTGDIAHIDKEGFLHITGRISRFSKIGGEMVPHIKVEEVLSKQLAEGDEDDMVRVCVTAVPDPKKGERLVVLHLPTSKTTDQLRSELCASGLPNLFVPATDSFFEVEQIPLLGTGKLDLKKARDVASLCADDKG